MKTKTYGYSELRDSIEIKYAVMIQSCIKSEEDDSYTYRYEFITQIDFMNRTWKAENNKEAYYFGTIKEAQDFCVSLAYNFIGGIVVECIEGSSLVNRW